MVSRISRDTVFTFRPPETYRLAAKRNGAVHVHFIETRRLSLAPWQHGFPQVDAKAQAAI